MFTYPKNDDDEYNLNIVLFDHFFFFQCISQYSVLRK